MGKKIEQSKANIKNNYSIAAATALFFKLKLNKPLAIIKESAWRIAHNDLDFTVTYPIKDEMG